MTGLEPDAALPPEPAPELGLSIRVLVWAGAVVAAVSTGLVFEHCAVFIADEDRAVLVLAALRWGTGQDTEGVVPGQWTVPFHGSVCGEVYRTGHPALIQDVANDARYRTYPGALARSELTVPISSGGRRIGVINLESSRAGTFGIVDLDRLTADAERAGASFEEAGLGADLTGPSAAS